MILNKNKDEHLNSRAADEQERARAAMAAARRHVCSVQRCRFLHLIKVPLRSYSRFARLPPSPSLVSLLFTKSSPSLLLHPSFIPLSLLLHSPPSSSSFACLSLSPSLAPSFSFFSSSFHHLPPFPSPSFNPPFYLYLVCISPYPSL